MDYIRGLSYMDYTWTTYMDYIRGLSYMDCIHELPYMDYIRGFSFMDYIPGPIWTTIHGLVDALLYMDYMGGFCSCRFRTLSISAGKRPKPLRHKKLIVSGPQGNFI